MNIRELNAHEIDFVAGGWCPPSFPALTSLSVSVSKTKTTNIASGNTATQTVTASANGDAYGNQMTGLSTKDSTIVVIF